jgi:hypothetical protein
MFLNLTGGRWEKREGIVWEIEIFWNTSKNTGAVSFSRSAGGSGDRVIKTI